MRNRITVLIPYSEGGLVTLLHNRCEIISEEHTEQGTRIEAYTDAEITGRLQMYTVNNT
jgi:GTP-binding protein HflX